MKLIITGITLLLLLGCGEKPSESDFSPSLGEIRSGLEGREELKTLNLDKGSLLLSAKLGGKIIGISTEGENGRNLFFTHQRLLDPGFLEEETNFFNPGGDRCWIAPSANFNFDENGGLRILKGIDPGNYELTTVSETQAGMSNHFQVQDNSGNTYELELIREIEMLPPPSGIDAGLGFVGYHCLNRLINRSSKILGEDLPYVTLKSYLEIPPPGIILVPLAEGVTKESCWNNYKDVPSVEIADGMFQVQVDGGADGLRHKLGFLPESVIGRYAYLKENGDGKSMAIIRIFPVDPTGDYVVENADPATTKQGDAIQIYDDNGSLGGFAEMEELSPVKTSKPGEELAFPVTVYALTGPQDKVRQAVYRILKNDI